MLLPVCNSLFDRCETLAPQVPLGASFRVWGSLALTLKPLLNLRGHHFLNKLRCVGVIWFVFSCCSKLYRLYLHNIQNLCLHSQIYDETYAEIGLEIGSPLIKLWLFEVCLVLIDCFHRSSLRLCALFECGKIYQYLKT
jgi:hypothetical protein